MTSAAFSEDDRHYMQVALSLAKRGLGNVWPNPAVGCVLVSDHKIVATGWTQPGGRPHAERFALDRAGANARGTTAYVTLEPCSHFGKTPPCAAGLIEAGVSRVISALEDPDPRVSGRGHTMLRDAGIRVDVGLGRDEARQINAGFLSRVERGRPYLTLKLASTMDGRSALANGRSKWITGDAARREGHILRANHDAIMVGADTVIADDPDLGCRIAGLETFSPVRIVLDRQGKLSKRLKLVQTADKTPTWVITSDRNKTRLAGQLSESAVKILVARCDDDHFDLHDVMRTLGQAGITRVMVESGGHLAAGLIRQKLVDRIIHFTAPFLIGAEGKAMIGNLALEEIAKMPGYHRTNLHAVGQDIAVTYEKETE